MYELWLCVVGGDDDDERLLCESDNLLDIEDAIAETEEEVITDPDKYFLINGMTFYSYRDFEGIRPLFRAM